MDVSIRPGLARGVLTAPPSKSMAHRLLLCAGLAQGESLVENVAFSQDIAATLDCLQALGAQLRCSGDRVSVRGADPLQAAPEGPVNCRESGSTLRFFIPLFLLGGRPAALLCQGRLPQRPQDVYETLCRRQGLLFQLQGQQLLLQGPLQGGDITLRGDVSSQFVSGLLFALPLQQAHSLLRLEGPVESRGYIDMTLQALRRFGVSACWEDERTLSIPGGQRYQSGRVRVEGDWSNAAFFQALNLLGGAVQLQGLDSDSLQGDRICLRFFRELAQGAPVLDISGCPDLGPILMAAGAACHGVTLTGTRRLQLKESDRGRAMAAELEKCGVACRVEENRIQVGSGLRRPDAPLQGHNDHRIVMSLAVLLTRTGGSITGAEAVSKSFPDFFEALGALGIEVSKDEDLP